MTSEPKKDQKEENTEGGQTPSAEVTLPRGEYEGLLKQVAELESLRDKLLRSAADFENAKKRLTRERDEFVRFSQESLLREILPVLDNFERALSHAGDIQEKNAKAVVSGIQMVFKQLTEILKSQGLRRLQSVGLRFDPNLHESMGIIHDAGPEDHVADEIEPGYMLHDRLLRAAKVRVRAIRPESSPSGEKTEELT